ncbi:MAG: SDR family oxidoreductase [Bryobacteraceae bacterium]
MPDAFSLGGEVALITGGGTGLGFAIASAFIQAGARVAITGRRESVLKEAANALGPCAVPMVHDVTSKEGAGALIRKIEEQLAPVSILVNNAGIHLKRDLLHTSVEEFQSVLDTHVLGSLSVTRAVLPAMMERRSGAILFMASMTSFIGMPNVVAYSAAKSAYAGMVRALACELGGHNIRVNAVAPGWIETPMLHKALDGDAPRAARILARTPMARFGEPADIGNAAVYLCSRAGGFVNGVVLPVDGGASIGF